MKNILLLHGAIGSKDQFDELRNELNINSKVYAFNFPGHGGEPIPENGFSIQHFAEETVAFMNTHQLEKISIFGYSMGGYVAMYLAKYFPERIEKIITLATKFHWDESIAEREVKMLDTEKIELKLPAFVQSLERRHAPVNWKSVLNCTSEMLLKMGRDNPLKLADYTSIQIPALILLGDSDKMVTQEESIVVSNALPNSRFEILVDTLHPFELVDTLKLAAIIRREF